MPMDSPAAPEFAPDRVLFRASGLILGVWLVAALISFVALDQFMRRADRASELALLGTRQAAALSHVASLLDHLEGASAGEGRETANLALRYGLARLTEIDAQRVRNEGRDARPLDGLSDLALRIEAASRAEDGLRRSSARAFGALLDNALVVQVDRLKLRLQADAAEARAAGRFALFACFALHLVAIAAVGAGVAAPARARIAAWMHGTREADLANRHRLLHDSLTGLPNAAFLRAHLDRLAAGTDRATTRQTAILRIDLDRFKALRETLGQRAADEIVRIAAMRLRLTLRASDFAAYLGQDDFVLVAGDLSDANDASGIAARVQSALSKPFSIQGGPRRVNCSIGVTMLSDDLPETDRVLANAEIALAEAQDAGTGNVRYFRESMRVDAERRETLFVELVEGIERGELIPFFQPQVDLRTGAFSGFEALVRWRHPRNGLLTPAAFLDFAEAAELTERIGEVVLAQSLTALTAWDAAGLHVPKVGINFAMGQLRDPRLIEKIKWEVERKDVDPSRISIEVLETVLIKSDADQVVRNLRGLASAGFQIDLDDFGTGHASIQNLRRFMVDRIKIDRSFVFGIEASEEQQKLTASMIAMAAALGIRTLAEGVETEEAAATLRRLGCDQAQGYFYARPMAPEDTYGWLADFEAKRRAPVRDLRAAMGDPNVT